jgi:hypothetical protein
VTPADVRRVARTYLRGLRLAYVGDPARLDQGIVRMFCGGSRGVRAAVVGRRVTGVATGAGRRTGFRPVALLVPLLPGGPASTPDRVRHARA